MLRLEKRSYCRRADQPQVRLGTAVSESAYPFAFVEEGLVFASDVTCEIVAQSRHKEFDGVGSPFVEESDLLRLFVNASARSQGDEGSIRRESGADRARQIVDDVVGTGIDLAEFVAGAVLMPIP